MAHLCNTKQGGNESSQAFIKKWHTLSYKCLKAPSHKALMGLCWNNLKPEVRSLIVGLDLKSLVKLIEAAHDTESNLRELENPSKYEEFSFPTIVEDDQSSKDTLNHSQGKSNQKDEATSEISPDSSHDRSFDDGHNCLFDNASAGEDDPESFVGSEEDDDQSSTCKPRGLMFIFNKSHRHFQFAISLKKHNLQDNFGSTCFCNSKIKCEAFH